MKLNVNSSLYSHQLRCSSLNRFHKSCYRFPPFRRHPHRTRKELVFFASCYQRHARQPSSLTMDGPVWTPCIVCTSLENLVSLLFLYKNSGRQVGFAACGTHDQAIFEDRKEELYERFRIASQVQEKGQIARGRYEHTPHSEGPITYEYR